jgi:competence protein ComEA
MKLRFTFAVVLLCITPSVGFAQLPDGPGRTETELHCSTCHGIDKSTSLRQDRSGWGSTVTKMIDFGAEIGSDDMVVVVDYLAGAFPAADMKPLNMNEARAIQMESRLSLKRSEASAIIRYRREHGDFKSIEDLKNIPGIDFAKIEAKKEILAF